ncbi:MAG TPA: anti-sigma factor [Acidimicrobiales bacterium]|nr:anti-sigma factor [Acidimicrobiales bacterium]
MSDPDARFRRVVGDDARLDPVETEALRRVVDLVADLDDDDLRPAPPPESLWAGIAAAVADDARPEVVGSAPDGADRRDIPGPADAGPEPGSGSVASPPPVPGPPVVDLAARRGARRRPVAWLAAAAAVVVLGGVIGVVALDRGESVTVVASAELEVLEPEMAAPGTARLVEVDGGLALDLEVGELGPVDGFFEVWLLTPEVDGLVSLGPVRSDGRYVVPDGLDTDRFSVVDVSIEPADGDPTHSGRSVLRGPLGA